MYIFDTLNAALFNFALENTSINRLFFEFIEFTLKKRMWFVLMASTYDSFKIIKNQFISLEIKILLIWSNFSLKLAQKSLSSEKYVTRIIKTTNYCQNDNCYRFGNNLYAVKKRSFLHWSNYKKKTNKNKSLFVTWFGIAKKIIACYDDL